MAWNETDVHVLKIKELEEGSAQVLKGKELGRKSGRGAGPHARSVPP